ncbi:MAG: Hsp33 family molecular chaperone HslO [Alphaproteobacteria bacterium]|nr:Hsp33 family molecular chaperone HslO [Alphaproteobacteria bacterium]
MIKKVEAGNDNYTHFADFYQPFLIDECRVKGNFIRLGEAMDIILSRHDYPDSISQLLAEQTVLACMLSGNLEEGGSVTMQAKGSGEGPVNFTVVEIKANGDMRGYAELKSDAQQKLTTLKAEKDELRLKDLLGEGGYLAITMTPRDKSQQYQGIVSVAGEDLSAALTEYFTQSEQIHVSIKVAVGKVKDMSNGVDNSKWYASGMMIQRMPSEGGTSANKVKLNEEEDWNRAEILMKTVTNGELLNPMLPPQTLLSRLFNEDGVWVYEPKQLHVNCSCSRERIEDVLSSFPDDDIEDMKTDEGIISVNCQFCNKTEVFRQEDITRIRKRAKG